MIPRTGASMPPGSTISKIMTTTTRKTYQRNYQRSWKAKRRAAWIEANGPCAQCGSFDKLEVDHINPEDKVEHNVWSWSEERREAELAKCQVLCGWCHQEKSTRESQIRNARTTKPLNHGTEWAYKRGCRCGSCKNNYKGVRRMRYLRTGE